MPAWLLKILVDYLLPFAVQFGVPWLISKFPWLPSSVAQVLNDLIEKIKKANGDKKEAIALAKSEAKLKLRRGIGSPPELVG